MKQKQVPDFVKSRMGAGTIDHPAFSFGCLLFVPSKTEHPKLPILFLTEINGEQGYVVFRAMYLPITRKNITDTNTRTETYFVSIQRYMSTPKL